MRLLTARSRYRNSPEPPHAPLVKLAKTEDSQSSGRSSNLLRSTIWKFDFFKIFWYNIYRKLREENLFLSFLFSSLTKPVKPPTSVVRSASRDKGWAPAGFVSKNKLGDKYKAKFLCDFPYGELNGKPKVDTPVLSSESSLRRNMFGRHSPKH